MADLLDHGHVDAGKKGSHKGGHKQDLVIAGTFLLVIIAWITLKKMQAGSSGSGTTSGVPGSASTVGQAGGGASPDMTGLQDQINTLSGLVSQLKPGTPPTRVHDQPVGGATPVTAVTPDPSTNKPASTPVGDTLKPGYGWFDTFKQTFTAGAVAQRFGLTLDSLKTLNPNLKITSGSTVIGAQTDVKVRKNAGAFDQAAYNKVNPTAAKTGISALPHPTSPSATATKVPKPAHPAQKG